MESRKFALWIATAFIFAYIAGILLGAFYARY